MVMKNISEAKAQLSSLIEQVQKGEVIVIGKAGKPVAKLVPYTGGSTPRKGGMLRGAIKVSDDFDALSPDVAAIFGIDE